MKLIGVHAIKHSDLGFNESLFGGQLLYWIDGDAYGYAMEVCDTPRVVTKTMDKCVWQKSSRMNHLIKIYSDIKSFGNTSVILEVEARRHNVYNGKQEVVLTTEIKFVRVDEEGYPLPITSKAKRLWNEDNRENTNEN